MVTQLYAVPHIIKGHTVAVRTAVFVNNKTVAIVACKTLCGTEPHKATTVLHNMVYVISWQTICNGKISEPHRRLQHLPCSNKCKE